MNTTADSHNTPPSNMIRVTNMDSAQLRREQQSTLSTPRRSYGVWASLLFSGMDLIYGREQWHLLILEELIQKKNIQEGVILYRILPQLIALFYYHLSWLLYVINPALSYRLNADFEDHAEHEYMNFVQENPAFETDPFVSAYAGDYGQFASLADLLRNIGVDERQHKQESEVRMLQPRFA